MLHQMVYESNCTEVAFMAHNMVLTLQALGLGGLYFSGLNRWSILGAFADKGIKGNSSNMLNGLFFLINLVFILANKVKGRMESMLNKNFPRFIFMVVFLQLLLTR